MIVEEAARKKEKLLVPALLAGLFLGLSFLFYHGIALSDEYLYAFYAKMWSLGHWPDTPVPFAQRVGFLWPLALAMKLLGGSPPVLILPAALSFAGLLFFTYRMLSSLRPALALPVVLLLGLNPVLLFYAADVSHDMLMVVPASLGMMLLWRQQEQEEKQPLLSGLLLAGLLFWSFLSKESVIYLAPVVLWAGVADLRKGRSVVFWRSFLLSALVLGGCYFGIYACFKGDALYRFQGMTDYNLGPYGYHGKSVMEKLLRLTVYPFVFLLQSPGYGLLWVPLVSLGVLSSFRKRIGREMKFPLVWLVVLLFMHWFGSSSIREWNPLTLDDRMWMLLIVPLTVLSVWAADAFRQICPEVSSFKERDFLKPVRQEAKNLHLRSGPLRLGMWPAGKSAVARVLEFVMFLCLLGLAFYPGKLTGLALPLAVALCYRVMLSKNGICRSMLRREWFEWRNKAFIARFHRNFKGRSPLKSLAGERIWRKPQWVLLISFLVYGVGQAIHLHKTNWFEAERAFLQALRHSRALIITDSLLVDKPLAHFDFDSSGMEQLVFVDWNDFREGPDFATCPVFLLYHAERAAIMRDFFHSPPPAWIERLVKERGESVLLMWLPLRVCPSHGSLLKKAFDDVFFRDALGFGLVVADDAMAEDVFCDGAHIFFVGGIFTVYAGMAFGTEHEILRGTRAGAPGDVVVDGLCGVLCSRACAYG